MLMPKRVKWRKQMRGRRRGIASRGVEIEFGDYALQALESNRSLSSGTRSLYETPRKSLDTNISG
jgi:large subunit ribosomal protein L16